MPDKPHLLPRVLVVGCGSIGERHLRCFQATGRCEPHVCDTNPKQLAQVAERYGVPSYPGLQEALRAQNFDGIVICTPAQTHLAIARIGAEHGAALLIEKPLAVSLDEVEQTRAAIAQSGRFVAVAYVYHHYPWFTSMREAVVNGIVGKPLHANLVTGQHFPTFRPAYRDIYYSRRETGGGAIQDALTHMANALEWMLGPATRIFCDAGHLSLEGVTVEDTVNLVVRHGDVMVSYALNQFQAVSQMFMEVHGELGSVRLENHNQRWGHWKRGDTEWTWHNFPPMERDTPFIDQANAFLDGMEGKPNLLCTFEEGVQTLRFNLAALQSADTAQLVTL